MNSQKVQTFVPLIVEYMHQMLAVAIAVDCFAAGFDGTEPKAADKLQC